MIHLSILVCFIGLFQASLATPILSSKPKPVNIAHNCIAISAASRGDIIIDPVPIILIHGLGGTKESWHGITELFALETKKKVCAVDLRNHGESPWNDEEFDVIAMTEDVRQFMDVMNAQKAIVLGHSLGARVAVHLALNYPERVEKVIVEDMRPNGVTPAVVEAMKLFARMLNELENRIPQGVSEKEAKQKFHQLMKEFFAKMNVPFEYEDLGFVPVKCSNGKCEYKTNKLLFDVASKKMTDLINESSGRYDGPALFIYGAESHFKVGEDESSIKKLFPNAELVAVEGADHMVHKFRKFETEVIKFINS